MTGAESLLKPEECAFLLVDFQAGLGFGVESVGRQVVLNNAIALARTAVAFGVPVVASTSASRVYSGPILPALQAALPSVKPIERRSMNAWEDDAVREAVLATNRKRLIVAGFLTEACVSFPRALCSSGWLRSLRCGRYLRRLDSGRSRPGASSDGKCWGSAHKLDPGTPRVST